MSAIDQYLGYARAHPAQFINPPGAMITILLDPESISHAESLSEARLLAQGATAEQARAWSRVGIAYQDPYSFLLRDAVRFGDGSLGTYSRFVDPERGAPGVIILPVYRGDVALARHFRHATRQWSVEIPRGFGAEGYSGEENALRELNEEIGGVASRIISLGMQQPNNGMTAETNELFFAELSSIGATDVAEGISEIQMTSVPAFERMMADGTIVDGFTLCAFTRARLRGLI